MSLQSRPILLTLQYFFCSDLRLMYTVADADALVRAADHVQSWVEREHPVEDGDPVQVAHGVFRHAFVPSVHFGKLWVSLQTEDRVELLEHRLYHARII